jgi:rhodanese-related sulfurtransferase
MEQLIEFASANFLLSGIWLALIILLVYSFIAPLLSPVKALSPQEVTFKINKEDAVVLDIRKPDEFKAGHITGARQLKSEEIAKAEFAKLEKHKAQPIIVVCAMGMNAKKTATQLFKAGFTQAFILKGGMSEWTGASLPVTK